MLIKERRPTVRLMTQILVMKAAFIRRTFSCIEASIDLQLPLQEATAV